MAVKSFETLKKMHLTTDLSEGAEIVLPVVRPFLQARTRVRSPY